MRRVQGKRGLSLIVNTFAHATVRTLIFLVVLSVPYEQVSAAGFNCTDAETAVEKRICENPELSRLDDQLTAAYREAIRNVVEKDNVRFRQQEWLKRRDRCETDACIKAAYGGQINLLVEAAKARPDVGVVAGPRRYPPYPDVWTLELPEDAYRCLPAGGVWLSTDGDVMVGYSKGIHGGRNSLGDASCGRAGVSAYISFFGKREYLLSDRDREDIRRLMLFRQPTSYRGGAYHLPDGSVIAGVGSASVGCGEPFTSRYERRDVAGNIIWRKAFFRFLKEPKQMSCPAWVDDNPYAIHVEAYLGLLHPLDDGTFLLDVSPTLVVRADQNLNPRQATADHNLFIIDATIIDKARDRCRGDGACLDREIVNYLKKY